LKILFLSQPFLYPLDTGGRIRTAKLLEQLSKVFDITLVSNFDPSQDSVFVDRMTALCKHYHPVPRTPVRKYSLWFYLRLLARVFSRYPVAVVNDYSKAIEMTVLNLLKKESHDLVVCDFLQPSLNLVKVKDVPTILFQHNVESVIVKRHYETTRNPFAKLFWWDQWHKMERFERKACRWFTAIVAVSELDKTLLEERFGAQNVRAIPTGIDTSYFMPRHDRVEPHSLIFTGSMDWLPNEDAIRFFVREILPLIKEQVRDVKLTVVGRHPSRSLLAETQRNPEVTLTGRVDDVRPYIARHAVYVIPLRIGGGTRIKVYEAMAMGKAVVSTRVGVEGLPVQNGENIALADEPREFADAVVRLLRRPEERERLGSKARSFVAGNFSWEKAAKVFSEICLDTAGDGGSSALGAVCRCDTRDFDSLAAPIPAQPK